MITLTIKGISREAHRALKRRAATQGRSLNSEVISLLESSVQSAPVDVEVVIQRARQFRNSLKFRMRATDVKRFKEEGRS